MKVLTIFIFSLLSLSVIVDAQTADNMLHKVSVAIGSGQQAQAVSYFRQAIALNIERSEMFYWTAIDKRSEISLKLSHELALAYQERRNYDKAYLFYKELQQKNSDDINYLENIAEIQVCRGYEKDALRIYENILRLNPDDLAANIFLGNYYYLQSEQEKKQLENEYNKIPSPTKMQYGRYRDGLSKLFATGYEKARNSLQKVMSKFPSTEAQKTLNKILLIEKEVNR